MRERIAPEIVVIIKGVDCASEGDSGLVAGLPISVIGADGRIVGELRVLGNTDHLDVWNEDRFKKQPPINETDLSQLSDLGI